MRLKMPYGISNYEKIVNDGYYYVDKTMYLEKLENMPETSIMFLRPRKFGKTLFTSVIENYYDKNKIEKFDKLYGNTLVTSISKLERYRSCPFSYYLQYGLRLKEKEELKAKVEEMDKLIEDLMITIMDLVP